MKQGLSLNGLLYDGLNLPLALFIVLFLVMQAEMTNAVGMGDKCGPSSMPKYTECDNGLVCLIGQDDKFRCQENSNMNPTEDKVEDGDGAGTGDEFPPILQRLYDALYRVQTNFNQNNYK